jgi:2-phospho-L-lactate guanylyltransferase
MSKTWALVPIKSLDQSKSRLGPVLTQDECADLSRAMLDDVLSAIAAASSINQIAILTDDLEVSARAQRDGYLVIKDDSAELCAALDNAATTLKSAGAETVVVIPGDIPTISGADIDRLLAEHSGGLSLCSAYRDGGTNILVCSPPDALPFQYGTNSARRHLETAAAANLPARLVKRAAFSQDIDTPDDLLWLSKQNAAVKSFEFLHKTGITARINQHISGASA